MTKPIVSIKPLPGGASLYALKWEAKAEEFEFNALANIRKSAEKWAGAVASLLGIFSIVTLVKGPEDITKAEGSFRGWSYETWIGLLLIGAVLLAAMATYMAAKAAYGFPVKIRATGDEIRREMESEAKKAASGLKWSTRLALGAVGLLTAAIAWTWASTPAEPTVPSKVLVTGPQGVVACGTLQPSTGDELLILQKGETAPQNVLEGGATDIGISTITKCPGD
jgi:hypothetical protein